MGGFKQNLAAENSSKKRESSISKHLEETRNFDEEMHQKTLKQLKAETYEKAKKSHKQSFTNKELQAMMMQDSKDDIRLKRDQDFEVFMQNLAAENSSKKRESSISRHLEETRN